MNDIASFRRWLILGSGGAGKSTFARRLAKRLDLPIIHLDRHYWKPGWVPTPKDSWRENVSELSSHDAWIMDGNYSGTLDLRVPRADFVVFLDPPPWVCIWRIVKRRWSSTPRPDIPDECEDRLDLLFFWWVLSYRWRSRPRVLARLAAAPHLAHTTLRSTRDVERFIDSLE